MRIAIFIPLMALVMCAAASAAAPDLSVSSTADRSEGLPGDLITLHVTVSNLGDSTAPLSELSVYLSPEPMERLWEKVRAQMRPGSLFISNSFVVPGVKPDLTLPLTSSRVRSLYVWRV